MVVKPNKSAGAYAKSGYTDMQGTAYLVRPSPEGRSLPDSFVL